MASFRKILVIQTAFIGDVVLATALLEKLHQYYPTARLDFLLRKGNEGLLHQHPFVGEVLVWDKQSSKYLNLIRLAFDIRRRDYDLVVNLQRFFSTGFLMAFSGAKSIACFDKNPLSWLATNAVRHEIDGHEMELHEVDRNLSLIAQWTDNQRVAPRIYPPNAAFSSFEFLEKYITISPASVWFTKQFPKEKWLKFMDGVGDDTTIFLLGGKGDLALCNWLKEATNHPKAIVKAGHLTFLESAALMKHAMMNYVNDSAPLHFASAVDAPVVAIFCSTIPSFGFGPLSTKSFVIETQEKLACRPCGLHGKSTCPKQHFGCSEILIERLLEKLD